MYQALYRKWRPQTFDDVVGQQHITDTLRRQVEADRLSHAYLFVGTRGTGKTSCAKILAKAANCLHPVNGNPCNECASCRGIDSGAILDVTELDAASNNGVDHIRMLRDEAIYTPAAVKKRVYIIDEVHMLSTPAFNALLKILEEPPEHLLFILATTELNKVPATILSRCQRFSFKRITSDKVASRLKYVAQNELMELTDDAAELLSNLSEGSMRDALSLLDQCRGAEIIDSARVLDVVGLAGARDIYALASSIADGDAVSALKILNSLYMNGKDTAGVIGQLLSLYRDGLVYKIAGADAEGLLSGSFTADILQEISARIPPKRLIAGVSAIEEALGTMAKSSDTKIAAEMCVIKLADGTLMTGTAGLEARIERLESGAVYAAPKETVQSAEKIPAPKTEPTHQAPCAMADAPFDTEGAKVIGEPVRSEPKPEPEPKHEPKPQPAPAPKNADGGGIWKKILSEVEGKIPRPTFTFLTGDMHCAAEISGNRLTIGTKSAIAKSLIDKPEIKQAIKAAAEAIMGDAVVLTVEQYKAPQTAGEDKLDTLKKFGNIKFE